MRKSFEVDEYVVHVVSQTPCKPRLSSNPMTDLLPMVYRDGALDASQLPSLRAGVRHYPNGTTEVVAEDLQ